MSGKKRQKDRERKRSAREAFAHVTVAMAVPVIAVLLMLFAALAAFERLGPGITGFAVSNAEEARQTLTPTDRITEDLIRASEEAVLIKIANATVGKLEGTNSMTPLLGKNSTAIMIVPGKHSDIGKGDIIAYYSEDAGGLVVHRVIEVGSDEQGWFAVTRGDNAAVNDPGKVRFGQVRYVVVGILY